MGNTIRNLVTILATLLLLSGCQYQAKSSLTRNNVPAVVKKATLKTSPIVNKTRVAIVMPQSNNQHNVNQLIQLMKFGLNRSLEHKNVEVDVSVYDISDDKLMGEAIKQIIGKNINVVLGPLLSKQTVTIAQGLKNTDTVIISLSNDPSVTSQNVFVFGHAPFIQTKQIIRAYADRGHKNFLAYLPTSSDPIIGPALNEASRSEVMCVLYDTNMEISFLKKTAAIISRIYQEQGMSEKKDKFIIYCADDKSKNIKNLFAYFKEYNIADKILICGDQRLDIEEMMPIDYCFTGSANYFNNDIAHTLKSAIHANYLSPMDKLAYDLGAIAGEALGTAKFDKNAFITNLNSKSGYTGISGNMRFIDHRAQRLYDIIMRSGNEYKVMFE